jgi:hypothetical protein
LRPLGQRRVRRAVEHLGGGRGTVSLEEGARWRCLSGRQIRVVCVAGTKSLARGLGPYHLVCRGSCVGWRDRRVGDIGHRGESIVSQRRRVVASDGHSDRVGNIVARVRDRLGSIVSPRRQIVSSARRSGSGVGGGHSSGPKTCGANCGGCRRHDGGPGRWHSRRLGDLFSRNVAGWSTCDNAWLADDLGLDGLLEASPSRPIARRLCSNTVQRVRIKAATVATHHQPQRPGSTRLRLAITRSSLALVRCHGFALTP